MPSCSFGLAWVPSVGHAITLKLELELCVPVAELVVRVSKSSDAVDSVACREVVFSHDPLDVSTAIGLFCTPDGIGSLN